MKNICLIILLLLSHYYADAFGISSGRYFICIGTTDTLTSTTPGGTWSCSSPTATIDATTGAITGISHGRAYITYTVGASSFNDSVYVRKQIYGPSTVCLGSTIGLSDSLDYSFDPLWTGIEGAVALVDSNRMGITLQGVSLGTTVVSYVNLWGCPSTQTITVTAATCTGPPVAGIATIGSPMECRGMPALLTLSGHTDCGTALQWQSSTDGTTWTNIPSAVASTFICNPIVMTHYRCKVTCIASGAIVYSNVVTRTIGTFSITSHSEYLSPTGCNAHFSVYVDGCTSTFSLVTSFGDGNSDTVSQLYPWFDVPHYYALPGTYTVKHFLYDDNVLQDSVSFLYTHISCSVFPISVYYDFNNNCTNDTGDLVNLTPVFLRVDSNSITVDTVMISSGIYWSALGPPGTIYRFSLYFRDSGFIPCPGYILDTVPAISGVSASKSFALQCSTPNFDLRVSYSRERARPTGTSGTIYFSNIYCAATSPTVTLSFSPKYNFSSSIPPPSSVVGNVVTWNAGLYTRPFRGSISYNLVRPGLPLLPGDTVQTTVTISPTVGDINTTNNIMWGWDTVRVSYDPNDITVSPAGNIPNNTTLQYTVRFENTGNDTAHNIYVLDTLPDNVDPRSLDIVSASAAMYISITNIGGHNIAKFDFPNIKLLDSSHHGLNTGMFVFKIKTYPGLADGTHIPNRVGIYFDDNEVVMTNTAHNIILIPSVSIAAASGSVICEGALAKFTATAHSFDPIHYKWYVNGTATSIDSVVFTSTTLHQGDTVQCRIVNAAGDSVFTASNLIGMSINPLPSTPSIVGAPSVCVGASTLLSAGLSTGTWSANNSNATVLNGNVTGISAGVVFITFTATNSCGSTIATHLLSVDPLPAAGDISGPDSLVLNATASLTSSTSGGSWTSGNSNVTVTQAGEIKGMSIGSATISYQVSDACGTATATHAVAVKEHTIVAPPKGVTIHPNPASKEVTISNAKGGTLRIINLVGQEVYSGGLSQDSQQISIAHLPASVYLIQVFRENGEKVTFRLVKE